MGETHRGRGRTSMIYGGVAMAVALLMFIAVLAGMAIGKAPPQPQAETAAQTSVDETTPEPAEPEPEVTLVVPTREPSEPEEEPPAVPSHIPTVHVPGPGSGTPRQRPAPAQPVPTPAQQEPRPPVDVEPEFICPSGEVHVSLDGVDVGGLRGGGPGGDYWQERELRVTGSAINASNGPVLLGIMDAPAVYAIDSGGETLITFYPEFEYTPAPGEMMPNQVSVPPGESLTFSSLKVERVSRLDKVTHLVMGDGGMYPHFDYNLDPDVLSCLDLPVIYGQSSIAVDVG